MRIQCFKAEICFSIFLKSPKMVRWPWDVGIFK